MLPVVCAQTAGERRYELTGWMLGYTPLRPPENALYDQLRRTIPLIDAALDRIVRLIGAFKILTGDPGLDAEIELFLRDLPVAGGGVGIQHFLSVYLDNLLTYGNAVGEILMTSGEGEVAALYNAPLSAVEVGWGETPLDLRFLIRDGARPHEAERPELILFTPLSPRPGEVRGRSLLESLPFVSSILLEVFSSLKKNFERVGNLRYAVTYHPADTMDRANARETAQNIAKEWSEAMAGTQNGVVKDFVAVGDVQIKVIGADNQMIDCAVPVRTVLEQIVAKLGIPPFLLGLSWSSTERMSKQQADILTSELESYRAALTPVIVRIVKLWLATRGRSGGFEVDWGMIDLLDETEAAHARLYNAQAAKLEQKGE